MIQLGSENLTRPVLEWCLVLNGVRISNGFDKMVVILSGFQMVRARSIAM